MKAFRVGQLCAGLLVLGACKPEEPIFVMKVFPGDLPQGTTNAVLVGEVQAALKHEGFILAEGSKRNYVAKVDIRRENHDSDGGPDHWVMHIELAPRDGGMDPTQVPLQGVGLTPADEATPNQTQFKLAAAGAVDELASERALLKKPAAVLGKALSADSSRVRDFAIRLAGARRSKDLVPVLAGRLTAEPEPELVLRIVGTLVQIGDIRAVSPLVELTKRKHPIFINQIVYALAAIGGGEAEAYLDTLAQGHPSDQVRAAAKEALGELLSKKSAKAKSP